MPELLLRERRIDGLLLTDLGNLGRWLDFLNIRLRVLIICLIIINDLVSFRLILRLRVRIDNFRGNSSGFSRSFRRTFFRNFSDIFIAEDVLIARFLVFSCVLLQSSLLMIGNGSRFCR